MTDGENNEAAASIYPSVGSLLGQRTIRRNLT